MKGLLIALENLLLPLAWLLAYSKSWGFIAVFDSMVLLRSLNELVYVMSCLAHKEPDKMVGKRNS